MIHILTYFPFIISFLTGYILVETILKKNPLNLISHIALAFGVGLGLSGQLTFISFLVFNQFFQWFIISLNVFALTGLVIVNFLISKKNKHKFLNHTSCSLREIGCLLLLMLMLVPLILQAQFFPHGGWDAWSTWNLKAKFLLLGQTYWQNIFDPVLWRSSPHYPLLLPLINVWGWTFHAQALSVGPLITTVIFTFATVSLLFDGIKTLTGSYAGLIAALIPVILPLTVILIVGQYADILVGYYILAAVYCLILAKKHKSLNFLILAGFLLGCLSFVKGEGFLASLILIGLSIIFIFFKTQFPQTKRSLLIYGAVLLCAFLSTILFSILYATDNQTFVNGWTSESKPVTLDRFKIVAAFYWFHFTSIKWKGLWIAIAFCLGAGIKNAFNREIWIIPSFVIAYNAVIILYYCTNTHFEITWWLQSSFTRLGFAIQPLILFWGFYALWSKVDKKQVKDA